MYSLSLKKSIFIVIVSGLAIMLFSIIGCDPNSSSSTSTSSSTSSSTDSWPVSVFTFSGSITTISKGVSLAAVSTSKYIYAVNTSTRHSSEAWRKMMPLNSDGSFSIELSKDAAWVVAFIDTSKTGADMIDAIFKAGELDTVAPKHASARSETHVGELTVDSNKRANIASYNYYPFIEDLGMSSDEALQYGLTDDMCLRLINPDMDSDGIVDIEDPDMPDLGMASSVAYRYGDANTMLNYLRNGASLPTDATLILGSAGVSLHVSKADTASFSQLPGKWSLEWSDSGSYNGKNPAEWNGTDIPDYIVANDINDDTRWSYNISFPQTVDLPEGNYTYRLYTDVNDTTPFKTLKLPYVYMLDDVNDTSNIVIPFPHFNVDVDGNISSVDYAWMRHDGTSFVPATREDIEMAAGGLDAPWLSWGTPSGGFEYLISPRDTNYTLTGSITPAQYTSLYYSGSSSVKRSELSYVKVLYTTKAGMDIIVTIDPDLYIMTRAPESYP